MIAAPWFEPPSAWSLNGRPMRVAVPSTVRLVQAMIVPDASGLAVVMVTLADAADRSHLIEQIATRSSPVDLAFLDDVADGVILPMLGMPRWTAQRLWEKTLSNWHLLDGELLMSSVDIVDLAPARATNVVYAAWRRLFQGGDGWKKFLRELETPPIEKVRRQAVRAAGVVDVSTFDRLTSMAGATSERAIEAAPRRVDSEVILPGRDTLT